MRLLPVIRLSIETDETTSPERQLDKIQTYARLGDHDLVPITEADYDLNVSGSVSPFERPGVRPSLQDHRRGSGDGLCAAEVDPLHWGPFYSVQMVARPQTRG